MPDQCKFELHSTVVLTAVKVVHNSATCMFFEVLFKELALTTKKHHTLDAGYPGTALAQNAIPYILLLNL